MAANLFFLHQVFFLFPQLSPQQISLPLPSYLGHSSEQFHHPGMPREKTPTGLLQEEGVGHRYYDVDQKAGPWRMDLGERCWYTEILLGYLHQNQWG